MSKDLHIAWILKQSTTFGEINYKIGDLIKEMNN